MNKKCSSVAPVLGRNPPRLPDSLLLNIFSYLDKPNLCCGVRGTCQQWKNLSYDFSLWQKLDISESVIEDGEFLSLLQQVKDLVVELNVSRCTNLTDRALTHANITCTKLRRLHVNNTRVTNEGLKTIVAKYPKLEHLSVYMCPNLTNVYEQLSALAYLQQFINPYLSPNHHPEPFGSGFRNILECCADIRELIVDETEELNDDTLSDIGSLCPGLLKLQFASSLNVSDRGLALLASKCTNLTSLNIAMTVISDIGITEVAKHCAALQELTLSGCPLISDKSLEAIGKCSKRLRCLVVNEALTGPAEVTDQGIIAIANGCPNLDSLAVCRCMQVTDVSIEIIAKKCLQLQKLYISNCNRITDRSISALVQHSAKLKILVAQECLGITDASVSALLHKCTNLQVLDFCGCENIKNLTPSGCRVANEVNRESSLSVLDISLCDEITDESLKVIADTCPRLDNFFLHGCDKVTDKGLKYIIKSCPLLQNLEISIFLSQMAKVTDDAFCFMANTCMNLNKLNLRGNMNITETGLCEIMTKCRSLRKLHLTIGEGSMLTEELVTHIITESRRKCVTLLSGVNDDYNNMDINFTFPPLVKTFRTQSNKNIIDFGF